MKAILVIAIFATMSEGLFRPGYLFHMVNRLHPSQGPLANFDMVPQRSGAFLTKPGFGKVKRNF